MIGLETETDRRYGVTFVTATVTNERTTSQLICLEPRIDGPIWVPRPGTATATEWVGEMWSGVVNPGRTRGVGFATSVAPPEQPLECISATRASGSELAEPKRRLAALEDWAPPGTVLERDVE
ncbi:DUF7857 domain-containing protein [Natronobacterium gregoryi]|uniref:Uncharacterized protein n=1 Tax=Natronobacterium gregoryi (strain ATCC 43098 / DSM 3393 / CCM 3738 / CIP 104747 / IAM 13177 / JCM 8860 / NBRC 102187 / NCIMB 2189 / SP2) TaxID=797304 RepID=L0AHC1_NATGS|nr:hypothetical protein Natgr_1340 [Natronobacterium gregoryi SP2]PLK21525.1 hypothetical protein CYV19_04350 [Natronobacterium gregoryi SP2]